MGGMPPPKTAKFDKRGNILCPHCKSVFKVDFEKCVLAVGIGHCPAAACDRDFAITKDVAIAVNEIWNKALNTDPRFRKEFTQGLEEEPILDDELPRITRPTMPPPETN